MRRILLLVPVAVLGVVTLTGCGGGGHKPAAYPHPTRTVRLFESPLPGTTVKDGFLAFTPIGFRSGMPYIVGSHASFDAQGAYTRVRIVVENTDRSDHDFDYSRQVLVTADGKTYTPDEQATFIERQPTKITVGAGVRIEFDLLWDIPKNAVARAVRFFGDPPTTQGAQYALPR